MPLNVISNFAANIAQRNLAMSDAAATSSLSKLSSGSRVVSAKDDAASMAIGSRLSAEVAGLKQASVNAGQGISMLQIADGAMAKVNDILVRMKSLSVQSGSGQLSNEERSMLNTEYQALLSEIDRIALDTEFAGTSLVNGSIEVETSAAGFNLEDGVEAISFRGDFDVSSDASIAYDTASESFTVSAVLTGEATYTDFEGTISGDVSDGTTLSSGTAISLTNSDTNAKVDLVLSTAFDITADADDTLILSGSSTTSFTYKVGTGISATADNISVSVDSVSTAALAIGTTTVASASAADAASQAISNAIDSLQTSRATIGANQNRLEFAAANIATTTENTEAARSQLLDLDVASEMSNFVSKQILVQAGVSMLAQANQLPNNLLRLFQ